jgi:16S rRNA (cytosine1402-N4)-methyltransferase
MLNKAIERLQEYQENIIFEHESYTNTDIILTKHGYKSADFVFIDIGVNLEHFKDGGRGFSIKVDAPLDMRFDGQSELSAHTIINTYSPTQLQNLFMIYADFTVKKSLELGQYIVKTRKQKALVFQAAYENIREVRFLQQL